MPDLHHREAGEPGNPAVLLVHGYPESSYMWRDILPPLAAAGYHALAPDLPGYGDSAADGPATWERHVEALERFRAQLGLEDVALVVHDWGGLVGLRWACDHPDAVRALVISDTGFFSDGQWHDLAVAMRTPGTGEELVDGLTAEAFGGLMHAVSTGMTDEAIAAYASILSTPQRRAALLELYRSGEFSELEAYDGKLAALGVPTLLLWGADDAFAPVAGAERFREEIPDSELAVVDGAGHFVFDDAPERCTAEVVSFLD